VLVGLWSFILLPATVGLIPVCTGCSVQCYIDTVYTLTASLHDSPLASISLIQSLILSLLHRLHNSLLERATCGRFALQRGTIFHERLLANGIL
jgi:hypothetical protein